MSDPKNDAITTEGTQTEEPGVVGHLEPAEIGALQRLRQQTNQVLIEIGMGEVRKARLLGQIGNIEAEGQRVLDGVAARLGIQTGTAWQVTPDGKARVLDGIVPG